jgi:glycosyltransferase involved in cell wall biosynthesis
MIAPTPFFADRGCHVQIYEEIRHLQRLGHTIALCTYHNGRDMPGVDTRRIANVPWYRKQEAGPSVHKFYLDALLLAKSLAVAREFRPDVIHGHLHEGCVLGYAVSRVLGKPLLFDLQGSLTGELREHCWLRPGRLPFSVFHAAERLVNSLADAIITQSSQMAEQATQEFGVPSERIFLSMDGVDTDAFRPGIDSGDLRRRLAIPEGRRIVVFVGLLNRYQGVDHLLEAIPAVVRAVPDSHFLIMGFPNVEHYRTMAQSLGVEGQVTFTGRADYAQLPNYLALGEIAMAPKIAVTEADGKIYNYMAMGLPVVAFERSVSRQILGDLGVYAPLGDAAGLARAVVHVLADGNLRGRLSRQLRRKAVADYSWLAVAQRISAVYGYLTEESCRGDHSL